MVERQRRNGEVREEQHAEQVGDRDQPVGEDLLGCLLAVSGDLHFSRTHFCIIYDFFVSTNGSMGDIAKHIGND